MVSNIQYKTVSLSQQSKWCYKHEHRSHGRKFSYAVQSGWGIKGRAIRCPEISSRVLFSKGLFMPVVQFADDSLFTYCHLRGIIISEFQVSYQGFAVEEKGKDCFSTWIFLGSSPLHAFLSETK